MTEPMFERVALIGIGLIGSSLARVMRQEGLAGSIVACARRAETLAAVRRLGIADDTTHHPAEAADGADLVVVCTPIGAYAAIGEAIASRLRPGAIVSDVGSVKQTVVRDLGPHIPDGVHFVPAHPVAGTEHSGRRPALRSFSRAAGAFLPRRRARRRKPSRRSESSGAGPA